LAFVIGNICAANAFEMFAMTRKIGYEAIAEECLVSTSRFSEEAIQTKGFYDLDQSMLCEFAAQEELAIDELALFQAVHIIFYGIYTNNYCMNKYFRCMHGQ
jgi:hypothetical protein